MARRSWWLILGIASIAAILLRNYTLAALTFMMAAISLLALWTQRYALDGVSYFRKLPYRRGFVGETLDLQTYVENRKFLPLSWLKSEDPIPTIIGPQDASLMTPTHMPDISLLVGLFSLRWYERDHRAYTLLLRKRGLYRLGPARLESGDLFGLFETSREQGPAEYLTVFPALLPFQSLNLPPDEPFGYQRTRRRLYEDPTLPMGVRDYHPEDDFRRIHWPATARSGTLQVKVYQPVSAQVMMVCLNVLTVARYWEGVDAELLERLVQATAALIQRGLEDGYQVGLISNGALARSDRPFHIPPGRSPGQLAHLLTALAGVTPFTTGAFDRYLLSQASRLPHSATLVIVSAVNDEPLGYALNRLKKRGWRISLLAYGPVSTPAMPGIHVYQMA